MKIALLSTISLALLSFASASTLFKETFDNTWESRWVQSSWKKSEGTAGEWKLTAGDWYGDAEADKGIQTSQDARFYAISTQFPEQIDNSAKDLIVQFQVKFPQRIDCGGGYIKLLPSTINSKDFGGDSPYEIMFGPDVCGTTTKRTHLIFTKDSTNHLIKKTIPCETDQLSHVYTLILKPDNTYEVRIDGEKKESGSLYEDWDILPPKTIPDPSVSKPSDWIDDPQMDDPEDKKPEDFDKTPKQIPDPEAEKPEDWDDDMDGEWEAPLIDNPEYKGPWSPRRVSNPDYKGAWEHPEIANPKYKENNELYQFTLGGVGIELWQVKAGTLFDNILITDSIDEAEEFLSETWKKNKDAEKAMLEKHDSAQREKKEAERKKAEEERKVKETSDKATDDDEDDEDEDEDEEKTETKKAHDEL